MKREGYKLIGTGYNASPGLKAEGIARNATAPKHVIAIMADREKLKRGIWRASGKTTIKADDIDRIVDEVERELISGDSTEIPSKKIGELVAKRLKKLDKVAYIRFSSVFKQFVDIEDFEREVKKLI